MAAMWDGWDSGDHTAISARAASAVTEVAASAGAGVVALAAGDGKATVTGTLHEAGEGAGDTRLVDLPGYPALDRGRTWTPPATADAPGPVLGIPLLRAGALRGALYAVGDHVPPPPERHALEILAAHLALALARADEHEESSQAVRQLERMMAFTTDIAQRLEFSAIAQRIVDGLTAVTDFRSAAVTLRDGAQCRRLAASGLPEPRIGLTTSYAQWEALLRPEWRRGTMTYLIPPEAPPTWSDVPDLPTHSEDPDTWTARHGLVVVLQDPEGQTLGFVSVDEPRSRKLPDERTVESLEMFARQIEVALDNARMYDALRHAAERDSLTGLRNRRMCWEELEPVVGSATDAAPVALAVADIDDFKAINDRFGHATGDRALRHVADRLTRAVRETDSVYRIGGEEFVVALPGAGSEEAAGVLRRAGAALRQSRGDLPLLTVSIGVAEAPRHGSSVDTVFRAADAALYAAKGAGKDCVISANALQQVTR